MSDIVEQPVAGIERLTQAPVGRRAVVQRMAAAPVASAIAGSGIVGFATSASAASGAVDPRLQAQHLRYAINGGTIIDGYFAAPRGKSNLGVVVVIHDENGLDAKAEETARRYALAGYYAVAPDLRKNFAGLARDAQIAAMVKTAPQLKRFPRGNGEVTIVSAA
jgi:carboxymethylenebutenolidase